MQLFAFFSNEYTMRHILTNPDYQDYITQVPAIKKHLRSALKRRYRESHADALIDRYVFFSYDSDEVNIYSNIINLRIHNHSNIPDEHAYSVVEKTFEAMMTRPEEKNIISNLAEISLKHGVYATRIDIFNTKKYSLRSINKSNIHKSIEKMFFKKEIAKKLLSRALHAESPHNHDTTTSNNLDVSEFIALYINPRDKTFDFNTTLNNALSIVSIFACELENEHTPKNNIAAKHYFNMFFETTVFKEVQKEISNRLLGLLMWDNVNINKLTQQKAFIETANTHKNIRTKKCKIKTCHDNCGNIDSCCNSASKHFRVARESIRTGSLKTTKDI